MRRLYRVITAVLMIAALAAMAAPSRTAYAAASEEDGPAFFREAHKVKVDGTKYCFFTNSMVILTPDEIAELDDSELAAEVIRRSGLYMRKSNCRKTSHKTITAEKWIQDGGSFRLSETDLENMREAVPSEGETVKLYMDPEISTESVQKTEEETEDGEDAEKTGDTQGTEGTGETPDGSGETAEEEAEGPEFFAVRKLLSPPLLYVVIATKGDAKATEDICEEEQKKPDKPDKPKKEEQKNDSGDSEKEEMLPEYRTISMADRSGPPVEPTLRDGDAVELTWEDQGETAEAKAEKESNAGKILIAGLASAALAAAVIAAAVRKKHKR